MNAVLKIYLFAFLKRPFRLLYFSKLINKNQYQNLRRFLRNRGEVQVFANNIGMLMILNVVDIGVSHTLILKGEYEPAEVKVFKKIIHEGSVFVDVGANLGYFTLLAAKIAGKKGKVFAFEPDPYNFSLIKKNIQLNELSNVVCYNKAVAENNGTQNLSVSLDLFGDHNVITDPNRSIISVEKISLDSFLKAPKLDIVKVDIQGTEELVLRGLKDSIKRNKNIIIMIEFCPELISKSGLRPEGLINIIANLNLLGYIYESEIAVNISLNQIIKKAQENHAINLFLIHKDSEVSLT